METFRNEVTEVLQDMMSTIQEVQAQVPAPAPTPTPVAPRSKAVTPREQVETFEEEAPSVPSSIPADRALRIADELNAVLNSLKMGCVAGDVLDAMTGAKASIMSIVPSDPIMVKIDKWLGLVGNYPKRNELQARDVIKLKKDLKDEIQRYSLA
jgi:hypothetical protein